MNAIKIGHYCKNNAWSRIAHRGFYSCKCPNEIVDRVSVDDMELLYWFPTLKTADEKKIHKQLDCFRICGEWFSQESLELLSKIILEENKANDCSKEEAIATRRKL